MNPNREELLFQLALSKPATKRAAWLDAECDGDATLRGRLEALLAAHEQPDNLVPTQAEAARPTINLDLADAPDEAVGQTLGRYKLLECVGEGGCGVVYVAEQTEPVRRRVALKVIKLQDDPGEGTGATEHEAQPDPCRSRREEAQIACARQAIYRRGDQSLLTSAPTD